MEQRLKASEPRKDLRRRKTSGYGTRSHQKGLRIRRMPENDKTDTEEENFSLYYILDGQKDESKKSETFQAIPVECRNSSETSGDEHPFVDWPKESRKSNEKYFDVDFVFHKQNDQMVTFGNNFSEHLRVSRTKHSASIMMLSIATSTGEKMPPIWFQRC